MTDISPDKKIADKYQKKTPLEHIIDLPDTYIGSVDKIDEKLYVFDDKTNKIVKKTIQYIPGLERIFEEILLNAFDQTVRIGSGTTKIKVEIDKEKNKITIYNDGAGIPVIYKENEKVFIPEMIFGQLLTSGNYTKGEKRITGGKNGYGAKLANIFSTEFTLETVDEERKKKFKMTWKNNMRKKGKEKITDSDKKGYTKITFSPDLKRFGITGLNDNIISLMKKRVYDIAVNSHKDVSVYYNSSKIPIKKFEDYIKLYLKEGEEKKIVVDEISNERWSIGIFMNDDNFEQVSFVNGINTNLGGTHVDYITKKIVKEFLEKLKKKKVKVKNSYIKDKMFIFVKSFIENPSFNSQTKEFMTTRPTKFGSEYNIEKKFITGLMKTGIIEEVMSFAKYKEEKELTKTDGKGTKKRINIPKAIDATWAGTKRSSECKLILTEGDSAKTFVMSGINIIGREKFGVFPLKGKLLNVKQASNDKILKNVEINYIKQLLGLKHKFKYTNLNEPRYGGIIILTDQDVDGSHIKGLVMNFIHTFWPELIDLGFLCSYKTPIVKAFKGKGNNKQVEVFYSLADYDKWKLKKLKGWEIKYYKGLGSSKKEEAKDSFNSYSKNVLYYNNDEEGNNAINLAFKKDKADSRKEWLRKYNKQNIIEQTQQQIKISDFIHKELIHFSHDDITRSIPNIVDGFKPTQRKILYAGLKINKVSKKEIKVAQFAGYAAKETDYHHGEASVVGTVINMAQNFVGSNNINTFEPNGQFGSRLQGGKDSASERYIHTILSNISKIIFNSHDNKILDYIDSDGMLVEPTWYIPIVPMILINGAMGIGTGFSTNVLPHKLEDVIENIKLKLDNKNPKKLFPNYRGFSGTIQQTESGKYATIGKYTINKEDRTITINELPIGVWTENYEEFLKNSIVDNKANNKKQFIEDFTSQSTDVLVYFKIFFTKENFKKLMKKNIIDLEKLLKLRSSLSENNMYLFSKDGIIQKYKTPNDILNEYFPIRYNFYQERKNHMIAELERYIISFKNQVRFIKMVNNNEIIILNQKNEDIIKQLLRHKFDRISFNNNNEPSYDYLIDMKIRTLTLEKAKKLRDEYLRLKKQLEDLKKITIKDMWLKELNQLLEINKDINNELELSNGNISIKQNSKKKKRKTDKKKVKKSKKSKKSKK
jgi:DNA topoisomerase-2